MPVPLDVGLELPDADLAAHLGRLPDGLAEQLDASGAAYVVLGADRGARSGSPTLVGTLLARRTRRIGIVVGSSPQRDHPYNSARRIASLDHVSGGRAGLLALARDAATDLGVGDGSSWAAGTLDAAARADAVTAARKLWRTWPVESLDPDPGRALATVVRYADHTGTFSSRGPLNVPTTPQGEPVVFWLGGAGDPAAAVADVVLAGPDELGPADRQPGPGIRVHARVAAGELGDLAAIARFPGVTGVTIRTPVRELDRLAGVVLPALTAAGTVAPARGGTLRERLGIPRRTEPDLGGNAIAFGEQGPA